MEILKILKVKDKDGNIQSYNVGFSGNDFTDDLKSKLDAIEAGAQVNLIEKIRINGSDIPVSEGKMVDLGSLQKTIIPGKGLSLDDDGNLSITYDHTIFKIVESLPVSPALGDENKVHFVLSDQSEEGNIYTEYLWIGGMWEKMGEFKADIDLAPYLKKEEAEATYLTKTDAESVYVKKEAGKGLSTNDYTTEEKEKLSGIEEGAQVNVLEGVSVDNSPLAISGKRVNVDLSTPIATAKTEAIEAGKVTMTESTGTDNILKVYTFSQNGSEIGKVNVPKDLVVSGGSIVEVEGVKYLRLVIANQTAPVDIPVTDLVDVYKGSTYINIASYNTISVNFTALDSELVKETSEVGKAIKVNETNIENVSSEASSALSGHNTSEYAHADIRDLVSEASSTALQNLVSAINSHNADETAHAPILTKIQEIRGIAEGRSRALVFDTVEALDEWLAVEENKSSLKTGDNLFIQDTDVPDYWWDGTAKQPLETEKVDLTGYAKTADVNSALAERDARIEALEEKEGQHAADVEALIAAKETLGEVSMVSCDMQTLPTINGKPLLQIASGTPTMAPDFPGQLYFDTTNKKLYAAFGIDSVSNWVVMN